MGKVEGILSVLEGNTLEEIESIQNNLKGCMQVEIELRQTITTLECILMEAFSTIDAMEARVEELKEQVNNGIAKRDRNVIVMRMKRSRLPSY